MLRRCVSLWNAFLVMALLLILGLPTAPHAQAQGNLLANPGFEQAHGDGMTLSAPPGWSVWSDVSGGLVGRQIQRTTPEVVASVGVYEGNGAFDAYKGWAAYSIALYQTVSVQAGSVLRLSAYGRIWSCNSDTGSSGDACITGTGGVVSQTDTGANFRVGIDPAGGNNPNAGSIVWSGSTAPYTAFQQMTVDATASGGSVTVVLSASMATPARHQHVFWDSASLTVVSAGTGSTGNTGSPAQPTAAPPPALAAEVIPQGPRGDGSLIHTVRTGDTLWAIAVAYNVPPSQILQLNGLTMETARILTPGQELIIQPAPAGGAGAGEEAEGEQPPAQQEGAPPQVAAQSTQEPIEEYDPAPVEAAAVPALQLGEAVSVGRICTLLFQDTNPNRLRESGEALLASGQITLSQGGATVSSYTTDAASEPYCFDNLAPGDYMLSLTPPDGYGITTPNSYTITLNAGQTVDAVFGAAAGFVPPQPPPVRAGGLFSDEAGVETDTRTGPLNVLYDYSGVIVLGLAGVVLVGGLALLLLLRR